MAFKKISNRKLPKSNIIDSQPPMPISIEMMVIGTTKGNCNFIRLKYKGCPNTHSYGPKRIRMFKPSQLLIDMQRDEEIRKVYLIFSEWPKNSTLYSNFNYLTYYVRILDAAGINFNFSEETILWFAKELNRLMKLDKSQGGLSTTTAERIKSSISNILKSSGKSYLARLLPTISKNNSSPETSLDDDSFTAVGKFLHRGYCGYMATIMEGVPPVICPLFDKQRLIELNLSSKEIEHESKLAKRRVKLSNGDWRNSLVRIAILLTYMFTGINPTPLFLLKRRDVTFKKSAGDHYTLNTIKNRAAGQKQTNELGFTNYSKSFFESWLLSTEHWSDDPDRPVFPYFTSRGDVTTWYKALAPQQSINKILVAHGLPRVHSRIFRQTRSQMLMRTLNDIYEVADANNNSIATTIKHYINGVQAHHELANASASIALFRLSKGEDKSVIIADFEANGKDPLTHLEHLKYKQQPVVTQTGLCCLQPLEDKISKERVKYRNINPDLDICIDFLECFNCPSHAVVAEVENIWMMLSFYDSLRQAMSRPAYNSLPSEKFHRIEHKTKIILDKLRDAAPDYYHQAIDLNRSMPHPLYDDSDSIDDILRFYK